LIGLNNRVAVFTARYELNDYIQFRLVLSFWGLKHNIWAIRFPAVLFKRFSVAVNIHWDTSKGVLSYYVLWAIKQTGVDGNHTV